jgi:RHS repeat-associated protein
VWYPLFDNLELTRHLWSGIFPSGGIEETFAYNPAVGNVAALTNAAGSSVESNVFDGFGNVVATSGSSLNNRLANTKERDITVAGVITLDDHGTRYYNPQTGRYISADPLGYPDVLNDYIHVHNNPVNRIDPLGLIDSPPGDSTDSNGSSDTPPKTPPAADPEPTAPAKRVHLKMAMLPGAADRSKDISDEEYVKRKNIEIEDHRPA